MNVQDYCECENPWMCYGKVVANWPNGKKQVEKVEMCIWCAKQPKPEIKEKEHGKQKTNSSS